ncbi:TetR/AcrR family transcriptional regulator [uncultured Ellagibacter sp.]|uniref:TetR/AcrR family transcriptional regulator n=1 Tax=uncultured Ellagibacter sp. TaxID=2137580 RepID=UPI0026326D4F|nr:TetR/AcrR family transcriptional regulator [uncultured Ellagibacter sp.]
MRADSEALKEASTKQRIVEALTELVQDTSFDKIRVSDICEKAYISKATLYRHFENKYEIVRWLFTKSCAAGVDLIGIDYNWFEGNIVTTRMLQPHADLLSSIMQKEDMAAFATTRQRYETLVSTICEVKHQEVTTELEYQITAYVHTEVALVEHWFRMRENVSVRQLCDYIVSAVAEPLFDLLNEPEHTGNFGTK